MPFSPSLPLISPPALPAWHHFELLAPSMHATLSLSDIDICCPVNLGAASPFAQTVGLGGSYCFLPASQHGCPSQTCFPSIIILLVTITATHDSCPSRYHPLSHRILEPFSRPTRRSPGGARPGSHAAVTIARSDSPRARRNCPMLFDCFSLLCALNLSTQAGHHVPDAFPQARN